MTAHRAERAYYLSWCWPWRAPATATASRQDGWGGPFVELLEVTVTEDRLHPHLAELQTAVLVDHLGRAPTAAELAACPRWCRFTVAQLERALAPTRQQQLDLGVPA